MPHITSYFEIDARAETAYAEPEHIPCESYLKITLDFKDKLSQDTADQVVQELIANQLHVPQKYVKSISQETYEENNADEDKE